MVSPLCADKKLIGIIGGGTRNFLGGYIDRESNFLDLAGFADIVSYEPSELVITVLSGTTIDQVESTLKENGQMLPFEPPVFGTGSTVGGLLATGISGPRRIMHGPVRDHVLGVQIIDGRGKPLRFGGKVIKNVAGFDVSRLLVGSYGTLGIMTEISLKVLPRPEKELTQMFELGLESALRKVRYLAAQPSPISATTWIDKVLYLRLSGSEKAVDRAINKFGGQTKKDLDSERFWGKVRNLSFEFLANQEKWLWRVILPAHVKSESLDCVMVDWNGKQRWVLEEPNDTSIYSKVSHLGGHATCFSPNRLEGTGFHPTEDLVKILNKRVRSVFDPYLLFNKNRLG